MAKKTINIPMTLDKDTAEYFERVAKLADVKPETVMKIALAQYVLRLNVDVPNGNHPDVILRNPNGVEIRESTKAGHHYRACNALCHCGEILIVAPPVFCAEHEKGNPVMVCHDHGAHAYLFSDLVVGTQDRAKELPRG